MKLRQIHQVAAAASNFDETRTFYQDTLGARFIQEYSPPGLLFFEFSGTRLLFETGAAPATLYFWVDDIDRAHTELSEKGVTFESEPHLIFKDEDGVFGNPGCEEWMAFFKDPGGNTLAIATQR
ncbi:MAG: VOC family protein [Pseudomonadota bacterium]